MRKKWLWLLMLPVLLCGAIFWARDAAWKRQEARLRDVVKTYLGAGDSIIVSARKPSGDYAVNGNWDRVDFLEALKIIKLKPAEASRDHDSSALSTVLDAGNDKPEWGFYLSHKDERRWIHLSPLPPDDQWKDYELTPATCRALKKWIFALQEKDGRLSSPQ